MAGDKNTLLRGPYTPILRQIKLNLSDVVNLHEGYPVLNNLNEERLNSTWTSIRKNTSSLHHTQRKTGPEIKY